jgi:hypothetical protein
VILPDCTHVLNAWYIVSICVPAFGVPSESTSSENPCRGSNALVAFAATMKAINRPTTVLNAPKEKYVFFSNVHLRSSVLGTLFH